MAEPPPEPFLLFDSETNSFFGREEVPDHVWKKATSFECDSEVVRGGDMVKSDEPLTDMAASEGEISCHEDDSFNTDEEYQRDLEEQRIADEKNGHFSEPSRPAGERRYKAEAAARVIPRVFTENIASSSMNQDRFLGERESRLLGNHVGCVLPENGGCSSMAVSPMQIDNSNERLVELETAEMERLMDANGGGSSVITKFKEKADLERSIIAGSSTPNPTITEAELTDNADSSMLGNTENYGNYSPSPLEIEQVPAVHGISNYGKNAHQVVGRDRSLVVAAMHDLLNGENNAELDLIESRSLVDQNPHSDLQFGPTLLGSTSHASGQVSPLNALPNDSTSLPTSLLPQPNITPSSILIPAAQNPQPTTDSTPLFPAAQTPLQPNSAIPPTAQTVSHPSKKTKSKSKFPLPKAPTLLKNKSATSLKNRTGAKILGK